MLFDWFHVYWLALVAWFLDKQPPKTHHFRMHDDVWDYLCLAQGLTVTPTTQIQWTPARTICGPSLVFRSTRCKRRFQRHFAAWRDRHDRYRLIVWGSWVLFAYCDFWNDVDTFWVLDAELMDLMTFWEHAHRHAVVTNAVFSTVRTGWFTATVYRTRHITIQ